MEESDSSCLALKDLTKICPRRFLRHSGSCPLETLLGEVEVGNKTEWEVGICKDSVSRKGISPKPPGVLFSLIGLGIGDDYSLGSVTFEGQHVREPVHKVGIFLGYESGHIAFYNVTDESLIYSFPPASFKRLTRPSSPLVSKTKGPTQALLSSVL